MHIPHIANPPPPLCNPYYFHHPFPLYHCGTGGTGGAGGTSGACDAVENL